jgi:hypothetical protein
MYRRLDSPEGARFLALIREGKGLKPSARAAVSFGRRIGSHRGRECRDGQLPVPGGNRVRSQVPDARRGRWRSPSSPSWGTRCNARVRCSEHCAVPFASSGTDASGFTLFRARRPSLGGEQRERDDRHTILSTIRVGARVDDDEIDDLVGERLLQPEQVANVVVGDRGF